MQTEQWCFLATVNLKFHSYICIQKWWPRKERDLFFTPLRLKKKVLNARWVNLNVLLLPHPSFGGVRTFFINVHYKCTFLHKKKKKNNRPNDNLKTRTWRIKRENGKKRISRIKHSLAAQRKWDEINKRKSRNLENKNILKKGMKIYEWIKPKTKNVYRQLNNLSNLSCLKEVEIMRQSTELKWKSKIKCISAHVT